MNIQTLKQQLQNLRLSAAANELEQVLEQEKKAINLNWICDLLERELDHRKQKSISTRINKAHFPEVTHLETFDWNFNPSIDQQQIKGLANLDFVKNNQIALFLGQPGVGKTHVALALGVIAAKAGYSVFCTSVKRLSQKITLAKSNHSLDNLFKRMLSSKLWILDDWGVVSMDREVAEEVFDLLDRRKHSSALILTSNRAVAEWADIFPDPIIASATIDRLFDRAHILTFAGSSYRLKGKIAESVVDRGTSITDKGGN